MRELYLSVPFIVVLGFTLFLYDSLNRQAPKAFEVYIKLTGNPKHLTLEEFRTARDAGLLAPSSPEP